MAYHPELLLEVGGEDIMGHVRLYVLERPETAFRHFVMVRVQVEAADRGEDVDELALDLRLEHVGSQRHRIEIKETEFLPRLAEKGFENAFTIADMAADRSVPVSREQVLGHRAFLKIKLAVAVEDMQVDYRMEGLLPSVAPLSRALTQDHAVGIHDREHLRRPDVRVRMAPTQDRRGSADRIDQLNHI